MQLFKQMFHYFKLFYTLNAFSNFHILLQCTYPIKFNPMLTGKIVLPRQFFSVEKFR